MGHVREERLIKLLENALLEYLKEGNIPSSGELQDSYEDKASLHGDLIRSSVRRAPTPKLGDFSSASDLNTFIDNLSEDMEVLYKTLMKVSEAGVLSLGEWTSRAKALEARLDKLLSRCNSLLLTQSDATGYVSYVEDGFETGDNISDETTAFIDTNNGEVINKINTNSGKGSQKSNAVDLTGAVASFSLINTGQISSTSTGSQKNILSNNGNYVITVESGKAGLEVSGELKINLSRLENVTGATVKTDITGPVVVALQYSRDGYTWENVKSESPIQSTTVNKGTFTFRFEQTSLQYLKFIITKSSEDDKTKKGYSYVFPISGVEVFAESFLTGPEQAVDLYTNLRYPQLAGSNVSFTRVALEVCDEVPEKTSIDYYLRAYNGTSYSSWIKTVPLNRGASQTNLTQLTENKKSLGLAVVDFATPQKKDSSTLTTKFSSSLNNEALNLERDFGTTGLSYRLGGPSTTFANFYVDTSLDLIIDPYIARNIGYSDAKFPNILTDDLLVRDVPTGWGLLGQGTYYCAFWVKEDRTINFGTTVAEIDNKQVTEETNLSAGWHTFKTNSANWIAISDTSLPTTDEAIKNLDPLYPYNHKYLIEGFDYPSAFFGKKVYTGVDLYCQYSSAIQSISSKEAAVAKQVGLFNLLQSETDLSTFALDEIDTDKTILLLKAYSGKADQVNERVRLFYTRRYDSFEALELRARLETQAVSRTPTLSYYRVRVN